MKTPRSPRRRRRSVAALLATVLGVAVTAFAAPASALAESCSYDPVTKSVTAEVTAGAGATLIVVGGAIWFGQAPSACGLATTTNTDSIAIAGAAGTSETLVLDQRGGAFGPGFTAETNIPEIEIATALGDGTDRVVVYGTEGDDFVAPGQFGLALTPDGDVDVTFSPGVFPMEIHGLGGNDYINGRGESGAGLHFLGPLTITGGDGNDFLRGSSDPDSIDGGPGDDTIQGQEADDVIVGGPGNDTLAGGGENDSMTGGPGADSFAGSSGDDTFYADDGEADTQLSGGPGFDTAFYDSALDPVPVAVENRVGDGEEPPPPPPPPPGGCVYDATTRTATAAIAAGGEATLALASGQIVFGQTPAACGEATTTNTDAITVSAPAGSVERLTIDLSGGALAPGATAEASGHSEIEVSAALGDVADLVVVAGTPGPDTISVGTNGIALNDDADVDVTFSVAPARIELRGQGGPNTLSGRGGFGTGSVYAGSVVLVAGDEGDTLRGGAGNDELTGGAGADTFDGYQGADVMDGAAGNDVLVGGDGDDTLTGGPGADRLSGGAGADVMHAADDVADELINGGPGVDTAFYDLGVDPNPVATETKVPA